MSQPWHLEGTAKDLLPALNEVKRRFMRAQAKEGRGKRLDWAFEGTTAALVHLLDIVDGSPPSGGPADILLSRPVVFADTILYVTLNRRFDGPYDFTQVFDAYLRTDHKNYVVYWMGVPDPHKYHVEVHITHERLLALDAAAFVALIEAQAEPDEQGRYCRLKLGLTPPAIDNYCEGGGSPYAAVKGDWLKALQKKGSEGALAMFTAAAAGVSAEVAVRAVKEVTRIFTSIPERKSESTAALICLQDVLGKGAPRGGPAILLKEPVVFSDSTLQVTLSRPFFSRDLADHFDEFIEEDRAANTATWWMWPHSMYDRLSSYRIKVVLTYQYLQPPHRISSLQDFPCTSTMDCFLSLCDRILANVHQSPGHCPLTALEATALWLSSRRNVRSDDTVLGPPYG
ncbi:hypothetical protein JCM10213_000030 [Rhodosporidiobolus nylandii]